MNQIPQSITTLEIAEMMDMKHWQILRKLDGTKKVKGIIQILNDNKIVVVDYFIKSTYTDNKCEERPCYKVTKLGCDFLANKFNGEKGIVFTARYVKRFADMEQALQQPQPALPDYEEIFASWSLPEKRKPLFKTWFERDNWKMKIICERFGWTRKFLYHRILSELSGRYDLKEIEREYIDAYGHKPDYAMDLLEFDDRLGKSATRYIEYLLLEEC